MTDEFLIVASSPGKDDRTWTRSDLPTAKCIADQAVSKLAYAMAQVFNTYGSHKSDALYTVPDVET